MAEFFPYLKTDQRNTASQHFDLPWQITTSLALLQEELQISERIGMISVQLGIPIPLIVGAESELMQGTQAERSMVQRTCLDQQPE